MLRLSDYSRNINTNYLIMKNSINWFIIPTLIFERAKKFYNIIFNTDFEIQKDENWDDIAIIWNMEINSSNWCITSNKKQIVSQEGVLIYLNACWDLDGILNRVIPAWWKIKKPKTSIWQHWYIAHIQDSEWNIIWLHDYK